MAVELETNVRDLAGVTGHLIEALLLGVGLGAGDMLVDGGGLGLGDSNDAGTGVDGGNASSAGDGLAANDDTITLDIPVVEVDDGEQDGVALELGSVTATEGQLGVPVRALDLAAKVERELLGVDLALVNGVLEESVGLALVLAEAETHEGVGRDVGVAVVGVHGHEEALFHGDATDGNGVEVVLTTARATVSVVGDGGVVLVDTAAAVLGRAGALAGGAAGSGNVEGGRSGVELDGKALGSGSDLGVAVVVVVIVAVVRVHTQGFIAVSALGNGGQILVINLLGVVLGLEVLEHLGHVLKVNLSSLVPSSIAACKKSTHRAISTALHALVGSDLDLGQGLGSSERNEGKEGGGGLHDCGLDVSSEKQLIDLVQPRLNTEKGVELIDGRIDCIYTWLNIGSLVSCPQFPRNANRSAIHLDPSIGVVGNRLTNEQAFPSCPCAALQRWSKAYAESQHFSHQLPQR